MADNSGTSIAVGDARAHAGDAVTDAEIFMKGVRKDTYLMK